MKNIFKNRKVLYLSTIFVVATLVFSINSMLFVPVTSSDVETKTRTIVLDAGHGGEDGGAVSKSGIVEKDLNLAITMKVKEKLEDNNITVILTRSEDIMLYSNAEAKLAKRKVEDINKRIEIVNSSNADMLVSIHMNSFPQNYCKGWQIFFAQNSKQGELIAGYIQDSIKDYLEAENTRVPQSINNVKLVNKSKIPAIVVECGFLSNDEEAQMLTTEEYQEKIANGICKGIMNFYSE